jgi:hypothetical protein
MDKDEAMIQMKIFTAQEEREERFSLRFSAGEPERRQAAEFHGVQKGERGRNKTK